MDFMDELKKEDEWLKERKKGIGSSDIAIIMGVSPYSDIMTLWKEKAGIEENPFTGNFATARGKALEPEIRDWFNNETGCNFQPETKFMIENPVFRASADGVDHKEYALIEIKTASKEDHELARNRKIPPKYYPQCQWLMMVFGYEKLIYISNNNDENLTVEVLADKAYQEEMKVKALEFWHHVENKTSPIGDDNKELEKFLIEWDELKKEEKRIKDKLSEVTAKISEKVTVKKLKVNSFSISWTERKGSIQYDQIEELKGVDLEKYRGESSTYLTIKKVKS